MTKFVLSLAAATFAMGLGAANAADSFPGDLSPQHFVRHSNPSAFPTAALAQSALATRGISSTPTSTGSPIATPPSSVPQTMLWMVRPINPAGSNN